LSSSTIRSARPRFPSQWYRFVFWIALTLTASPWHQSDPEVCEPHLESVDLVPREPGSRDVVHDLHPLLAHDESGCTDAEGNDSESHEEDGTQRARDRVADGLTCGERDISTPAANRSESPPTSHANMRRPGVGR
jgi:hypothetical protein